MSYELVQGGLRGFGGLGGGNPEFAHLKNLPAAPINGKMPTTVSGGKAPSVGATLAKFFTPPKPKTYSLVPVPSLTTVEQVTVAQANAGDPSAPPPQPPMDVALVEDAGPDLTVYAIGAGLLVATGVGIFFLTRKGK